MDWVMLYYNNGISHNVFIFAGNSTKMIYTLNFQVVMPMFVQFSELSTWELMDAKQNTSLFIFILSDLLIHIPTFWPITYKWATLLINCKITKFCFTDVARW